MRRLRLRVDAQVRAADVLHGVDEDELAVAARALAPFCGRFSDGAPSLVEQIVHGLLEGDVRAEVANGDWDAQYESVFEEFGLDVGAWLERLTRLRVQNASGFCAVWDVDPLRRPGMWIDDDSDVTWAPSRDVIDAGSVYTLPIDFPVVLASKAATSLPKATKANAAHRPATGADPAVRGLAEHLRPRVEATFGGARRLVQHAELAPICAIVATVHAVMRKTARYRRGHRIYRPEVLEACLAALDLGTHQPTLERILLRDHPEHLHVDTSGLPSAMTPKEWRSAVGLFARNDKGELIDVSREARQWLLPRVLFSLSGPEPF